MIDLLITITMALMILVVAQVIGVIKLKGHLKRLDETDIGPTDN